MTRTDLSRDRRVLVIGLSPVKNKEVVESLKKVGIDAVGCTEPDSAAERYDARQFELIVFGRAALGPVADRLRQSFSRRHPTVGFVDAFGPVAVAQVTAALRGHLRSLVDDLSFAASDDGGQITATVLVACHIAVTLYRQPRDGALEETCLLDADTASGQLTCPVADTKLLSDAYSLVLVANGDEFHHLPFL